MYLYAYKYEFINLDNYLAIISEMYHIWACHKSSIPPLGERKQKRKTIFTSLAYFQRTSETDGLHDIRISVQALQDVGNKTRDLFPNLFGGMSKACNFVS